MTPAQWVKRRREEQRAEMEAEGPAEVDPSASVEVHQESPVVVPVGPDEAEESEE